MPIIEVDEDTKRTVSFAAQIANLSESAVIRRLIEQSTMASPESPREGGGGVAIYADYDGRRVRARYFEPGRVEILDGPLAGQSFKTPTGAARAVIRQYNPAVNDNRNGWKFWQLEGGSGSRRSLESIRPTTVRPGRGSLRGRLQADDDWDSPETNEAIARDFGLSS